MTRMSAKTSVMTPSMWRKLVAKWNGCPEEWVHVEMVDGKFETKIVPPQPTIGVIVRQTVEKG